jgi:hypothetical protein
MHHCHLEKKMECPYPQPMPPEKVTTYLALRGDDAASVLYQVGETGIENSPVWSLRFWGWSHLLHATSRSVQDTPTRCNATHSKMHKKETSPDEQRRLPTSTRRWSSTADANF